MPLPMTVISGYLGAGKTTLINRLLAEDHELRLLVMVNDFGAINIDEALLVSRDEDTIALTNGCVCCTMGADLFMAIGDILDRKPRPDHLIIEASGVADPRQIANAAIAEPEMRYGGIVTVVDGSTIAKLGADPLIGAQVSQQIACADLVAIGKTKASITPDDLPVAPKGPIVSTLGLSDMMALLNSDVTSPNSGHPAHPTYTDWHAAIDAPVNETALRAALIARPAGLFRIKGVIPGKDGAKLEVQVVGASVEIRKTTSPLTGGLVGIGVKSAIPPADIEIWWRAHSAKL